MYEPLCVFEVDVYTNRELKDWNALFDKYMALLGSNNLTARSQRNH